MSSRRPLSFRCATTAGFLLGLLSVLVAGGSLRAEEAQAIPGYAMVHLTRAGNYLVIRTKANGRDAPLLLDTGSPGSALDSSTYKRVQTPGGEAHLPEGEAARKRKMNNGAATLGWIEDLHAGDMAFGGGPILVSNTVFLGSNNLLAGSHPPDCDGIMGEDILVRYGAIIDPSRDVIYFNTDPGKRVHLGPYLTKSGWTAIPMQRAGRAHWSVPTEIGGKTFQLVVDTGSPFTVVDRGSLAALKLSTSELPLYGGIVNEAKQRQRSLIIRPWKIGGFLLPAFAVCTFDLPPALTNERSASGTMLGMLGEDVLLLDHALIDIGGEKLYLRPH